MLALTQITPWKKMRAMNEQFQKFESSVKVQGKPKPEPGVIWTEPCRPCNPFLTYYNNGKQSKCCKTLYDYHYFFCNGYDQDRHRDDRKHAYFYLNIDLEEQYPCRTVPICTSSNYGHRKPYDDLGRVPQKSGGIESFRRNNGAAYCISSTGNDYVYDTVSYKPMKPFQWNAQYGYTYAPPKN